MLMEQNIMPMTEMFDLSTKVLYSKQKSMINNDIKPDALLTPLLYAFNSNLHDHI